MGKEAVTGKGEVVGKEAVTGKGAETAVVGAKKGAAVAISAVDVDAEGSETAAPPRKEKLEVAPEEEAEALLLLLLRNESEEEEELAPPPPMKLKEEAGLEGATGLKTAKADTRNKTDKTRQTRE